MFDSLDDYEAMTKIVNEEVTALFKDFQKEADTIYGGGMLGDMKLKGPQELTAMLSQITDLRDIPMLLDPEWEDRIRQNLDVPPASPMLFEKLAIPGMLTEFGKRFSVLIDRYVEVPA